MADPKKVEELKQLNRQIRSLPSDSSVLPELKQRQSNLFKDLNKLIVGEERPVIGTARNIMGDVAKSGRKYMLPGLLGVAGLAMANSPVEAAEMMLPPAAQAMLPDSTGPEAGSPESMMEDSRISAEQKNEILKSLADKENRENRMNEMSELGNIKLQNWEKKQAEKFQNELTDIDQPENQVMRPGYELTDIQKRMMLKKLAGRE